MSVRLATLSAAVLVLLAWAVPAGATTLKGTVTGAPYSATKTTTAVPVIFLQRTATKAHLHSAVGVVLLSRSRGIAVPAKAPAIRPLQLRAGDRVTLDAKLTRAIRRSAYPRLTVKPGKLKVTQRSTVPTNDELAAQLALVRTQLAALNDALTRLDASTQQSFRALGLRVDGLQTGVDGLRHDLDATKLGLTALSTQLATATATLQGNIDQVRADLQPQVTALLGSLQALTAQIGGGACPATPGSLVARLCTLEALPSLDGLTATVTSLTDRVTQISSALTTAVGTLTGQTLSGDLPAALTTPVTTTLTNIHGLLGITGGLTTDVQNLLNVTLPGVTSDLSAVTNLVGGVDVGALQTTVQGLLGSVAALDLNDASLGTDLAAVQAQADALEGYLTGTISSIDGHDPLGTLTTSVGSLTTLTGAMNTKLTTVCSTWRTALNSALAGQSVNVVNSLLALIGSAVLPNLGLPGC